MVEIFRDVFVERLWRSVSLLVFVAATVVFGGCVSASPPASERGTVAVSTVSTVQDGAPYPADVEHLEEILSVGEVGLPEGATDVAVRPAVKFAEHYPGGWGYVIEFRAEERAIRAFVDEYTSSVGDNIELHEDAKPYEEWADIDFAGIERPWKTAVGPKTNLFLERPLGRGWLLIRGAPR